MRWVYGSTNSLGVRLDISLDTRSIWAYLIVLRKMTGDGKSYSVWADFSDIGELIDKMMGYQ